MNKTIDGLPMNEIYKSFIHANARAKLQQKIPYKPSFLSWQHSSSRLPFFVGPRTGQSSINLRPKWLRVATRWSWQNMSVANKTRNVYFDKNVLICDCRLNKSSREDSDNHVNDAL